MQSASIIIMSYNYEFNNTIECKTEILNHSSVWPAKKLKSICLPFKLQNNEKCCMIDDLFPYSHKLHIHINCIVLLIGFEKSTGGSYYDLFESKSLHTKIFV